MAFLSVEKFRADFIIQIILKNVDPLLLEDEEVGAANI